jgi:hypothetical protein
VNKVSASAAEAVADICDGASLAVGGFGLSGIPAALIDALHARREEEGGHRLGDWGGRDPGGARRPALITIGIRLTRTSVGPDVDCAGPSAIQRADGFGTTPPCTTAVGTSGSSRLSGPAASHDVMAAIRA